MAQVTVKLMKSKIGCTPSQRATLAALGLRKIRQENCFEDSPVVRGMINKVKHLVEVVAS
ncbi:50S ribosomal protein L30 [Paucidesulfovibrio longus]|jgi:large subunit ribosomal protein L30|uniref:50S ribosomal protein L30 n=1 Tax=Paucidesulfovibrio longus TaxID=889 RepID=UPI0003B410A2|nr:50S ribosomal protein L30 [Paucidesulfovibrio longus]